VLHNFTPDLNQLYAYCNSASSTEALKGVANKVNFEGYIKGENAEVKLCRDSLWIGYCGED
jgi:hypothetical protein